MDSYLSRIQALNSQLNAGGLSDEQVASLKNQKASEVFGGSTAAVSGGLSLLSDSLSWAKPADTTQYDAMIQNMSSQRGQNFYDNASVLDAYNNLPSQFSLDVDQLNPTVGQSATHIGGSALSGVMTGLTVGGPWGALIGGVIGLGSGIASDLTKRSTNKTNVELLNVKQRLEDQKNQLALNVGAEQAKLNQFANLYQTRLATGGFLRTADNRPVGYRIHHSHCKGGTLVRIKAK